MDLVVGVVTHTVTGVDVPAFVRQIAASLSGRGQALRWILAVAHTGSVPSDLEPLRAALGTAATLVPVAYALQPSDALDEPYHGQPGRARALRAILQATQDRGARGCIVVDVQAASPAAWLDHVTQALLVDATDYVAPIYQRHPFAGALIHGVVYPTFRALYGTRLRYPIALDFGCSRAFIEAVLSEPIWDTALGQVGIDGWMSATAVSYGFRVAQAARGPRAGERTSVDLSTTLTQVVGTLFSDLEGRAAAWQRIRGSRALAPLGDLPPTPDPPEVDVGSLANAFRLGLRELEDLWAGVLPPLAILQWRRVAATDAVHVDDALWARSVYDFIVGHHQRVIARDHLLRAFTPLYLGWLASFVVDVRQNPLEDSEARIERLCVQFENEKPYLISQWRWPERFRPAKLRR